MEKSIVILHGWKSNLKNWEELKKKLENKYKVYLPQLPGFGNNKLTCPYDLNDYVLWIKNYLKKEKIKKPILIGHSFGGRIVIKLAATNSNISKAILIAAAGIKPKNSTKKIIGMVLAKTGKVFFNLTIFSCLKKPAKKILYKILREKDYYEADEVLKKTMKKIINTDLTKELDKIKVPTLILWGKKDKQTPITDAYLIRSKIINSKILVWENESHALPFTKSDEVAKAVQNFC
ncbi:alpha/beta fold hydrolase [Patescibacteria group bacterium]